MRLLVLGALAMVCGLCLVSGMEIRWALTSNTIYATGAGSTTLSEIKAVLDQAPLEQVTSGVWHLRASLVVQEGAQLVLHGTGIGGDVDQLRLQSNNSTNTNRFVRIEADWGTINIRSTSVVSWDDTVAGPDTEYASYGRAFIGVRSRLSADGVTPLESRMDIIDSDIGYLGYDQAEGYGVSWKVAGDQSGLYDRVDVFGDILNSRIHHNYFGVYTFGAFGMRWLGNEVDHNVQYGFDPHDDSDHLLIQGNTSHHNGNHGIIASMRCDHLTIRSNTCWANGQNGIMLHRSSDDCLIEDNHCYDNLDTGIVIAGSSRNTVRRNLLAGNFEAGLRLNLGASDNLIEANASVSNTWYGFFLFKGLDVPEPGDDGRPKRNRFVSNVIRSNGKEAISLADSDDNLFASNQLYANGDKLRFERGLRNRLDGNDIPADVTVRTEGNPSPAASTFITPRSSLIIQVDTNSAVIFEDPHGRICDPDEKGVATSVTPDGSRLILTAAEIGTTSKVEARSFWVRPTQGTVRVNPTGWTNGYGSGKQWVVQAEAPGQNLTYTVEDLAPNSAYSVHKAAFRLMSVNSDSSGKINFADITDGTNDVLYAIEPDLQVAIARQASGLVVSWTGGRLQSATGMALSTWREVSVPPGPFQTNIQPSGTMGFFRAVAP